MRGVFAREHRVGLRSRRDEDRPRRQASRARTRATRRRRRCDAARPRARARGRSASTSTPIGVSPSAKRMPSSSAFSHFLVIERVRRAVDRAAAIGDRHAAPRLQQLEDAGARSRPPLQRVPLGANRTRVREELVGDARAPRRSRRCARPLRRARARGARSAAGISRPAPGSTPALRSRCRSRSARRRRRRPAAAPACSRSEVGLGRAGELQRHQEVRCRAHAAREPVRQARAPSGARARSRAAT